MAMVCVLERGDAGPKGPQKPQDSRRPQGMAEGISMVTV